MIKKCRSCRSNKLVDILSLGNQHLSDFVDIGEEYKERAYPLNLVLCRECSLVQLRETTPPQVLYTDHYGYRSGINKTMREELARIALAAFDRVKLYDGDIVVDIGANAGTLLSYFPTSLHRVAYEPVSKLAKECDKHASTVFNEYFNAASFGRFSPNLKAKIVTAISMFYDLDDPNVFVSDVAKVLHEEGIFVIQQNYLVGMLEQKAFDNIVHEHLEYYSLSSLEPLLYRHGLEIVDAETNDINGGSFRTYVRHLTGLKKMRWIEEKLKLDNQWTYYLFALQVRSIKTKLTKLIKDIVAEGKTIYVFGASTRGNTLLQYCDLDNKVIKAAVERNPDKFGKKIASTNIPIISEEQAEKEKFDYALFLPWFFHDELMERYKHLREKGVKFIFPLPDVEVI